MATGSTSAARTIMRAPSTSSTLCATGSSKAEVLVTGAAGLVGAALARALAAAGHHVIALRRQDGDVAAADTWGALPEVEHVFHLAARTYVPDSWRDPSGFMATNVTGTTQALEYCRATGAHLVLASTSLFGTPKRLP